MTIIIKTLQPLDISRWDDYVKQHAKATFFHGSGWQSVIQRAFGHDTYFLYAENEHHHVVGVYPLAQLNSKLFGNSLIALPFCVVGGVIADDQQAYDALHQAGMDLADRLQVDYLEARHQENLAPAWPTQDLYVSFRRAIHPEEEQNWLAIPRKQRAMIRKAMQYPLQIVIHQDVQRFVKLYEISMRHLGTPGFGKRYFSALDEIWRNNYDILTITHQGRDVASVLNFYFKDTVLPYYAGSTAEARALKANDFMYWSLWQHAQKKGMTMFDFGRSKRDSGSYHFKKNWGFEEMPLYYQYYLRRGQSVPNRSPTNPKYRLPIMIWRHLPLWLTRWLGPPVAKYLG